MQAKVEKAEQMKKIGQAADRTVRLVIECGAEPSLTPDKLDLIMSLEKALEFDPHALDLDTLLGFEDGDLAHDVLGVHRHLDRESGELGDGFLPRAWRGPRMPEPGALLKNGATVLLAFQYEERVPGRSPGLGVVLCARPAGWVVWDFNITDQAAFQGDYYDLTPGQDPAAEAGTLAEAVNGYDLRCRPKRRFPKDTHLAPYDSGN